MHKIISNRTIIAAGALCLTTTTLTACGSTVQWRYAQQRTPDEPSSISAISEMGQDPLVGEGGIDPGTTTHPDRPSLQRDPQAKSRKRTTFRPAGSPNFSPGDDSTEQPQAGPGYDRQRIFVGYSTLGDVDQGTHGAGFQTNFGDQSSVARAIVNYINRTGGILGRKLELVIHDVSFSQAVQNPDGAAQAMCEHWTVDRRVFAAINLLPIGDNVLATCLSKRQTPQIAINALTRPQNLYEGLKPYLYAPTHASMSRIIEAWLKRLNLQGYFNGWDTGTGRSIEGPSKIGVISNRQRYGMEFASKITSELGRYNQRVVSYFEYSGDAAKRASESSAAVLRFTRAGVTHVMSSGDYVAAFMQTASSQRYRPRYAINSDHVPNFLQGNVPKDQLIGAIGVGHFPTLDVDNQRDPGRVSAHQLTCEEIMRKAGLSTDSRERLRIMLWSCDGFKFLVSALKHGSLSGDGLYAGSVKLKSMAPASTFRIDFSRGRVDGASAVRDLSYSPNCECFRYRTPQNYAM